VPNPTLRETLFAKYAITDQEAQEMVVLLRAVIQTLAPTDADGSMSALIAQSRYSRQAVYSWIHRIVFLLVWMLRGLPRSRPAAAMSRHPLWECIKAGTIDEPEGA